MRPQELIRLWNSAAEALFGFTAEEAVGQSMDIIIPERLTMLYGPSEVVERGRRDFLRGSCYLAETGTSRLRMDRSAPTVMGSAPRTMNTVSPATRIHSSLWKVPLIE
jgi:PAS domain S-box-containing protein